MILYKLNSKFVIDAHSIVRDIWLKRETNANFVRFPWSIYNIQCNWRATISKKQKKKHEKYALQLNTLNVSVVCTSSRFQPIPPTCQCNTEHSKQAIKRLSTTLVTYDSMMFWHILMNVSQVWALVFKLELAASHTSAHNLSFFVVFFFLHLNQKENIWIDTLRLSICNVWSLKH